MARRSHSTYPGQADERPGEEGKTITIAPGVLSVLREGTPVDLKRRLNGELDGIVLKALEKDPHRLARNRSRFARRYRRGRDGSRRLDFDPTAHQEHLS